LHATQQQATREHKKKKKENPMKSIISHRGYSIAKSGTDAALLQHHRDRLTITPHVEREEYAHLAKPIAVYQETAQRLYMPRFYGLREIGPADKDKVWSNEYEWAKRLKFKGKPRDNQLGVIDVTLKSLEQRGGGVISIECGGGKTCIALYLGCQLNGGKPPPMAVVCHTTAMMKQWQERISQFVPTARIGLVQRDKLIVEDKDIIIMSVKTVAKRKYSKHAFERIGFVVWDEIHLMCTRTFSKAFPKLATKYTLGLSATPYRNDQCDIIFQNYIGPVVYMRKRQGDANIEAQCITFLLDDIEVMQNKYGKIMYTPTCVAAVNRDERNQWLAQKLAELASSGRTILVLSEYVKHLETLHKLITCKHVWRRPPPEVELTLMMAKHRRLGADSPLRILPRDVLIKIAKLGGGPVEAGLYIGKMKNEERKDSEAKHIILGTYKLASVGMDIPSLNTLLFASPRKDIEQSVGRILRKKHDLYPPLIIDIIDNHTVFQAQARVRKKFYAKYNYTIVHQRVNQDGTIKSTRRSKAKTKAIDISNTPPDSDESDEQQCLF
jgi:superfamily II DNA or RNA helicase